VGQFPSNPWGLHDMHGNVREWCLDNWHDSYEGAPNDGSAWVFSEEDERSQIMRLLRGGCWSYRPGLCRSAYRVYASPGLVPNFDGVGFRVVCLPQDPSLNP
jgi:formylglycine-generating enzyme required for sulfatase activity